MAQQQKPRSRRSSADEVNEAVDALLGPEPAMTNVSPELAAVLRIAAELRELPRGDFKARLKAVLHLTAERAAERAHHGPVLMTEADIRARVAELSEPQLVAHDVAAALADLPDMTMRFLARLNNCMVGVSRGSTPSHWERHPAGDELLHILTGEADITTLTNEGAIDSRVGTGSLFVCPQGLWHQVRPRTPLTMLFVTPGDGTEHTAADVPSPRPDSPRHSFDTTDLVAHDLSVARADLPERVITAGTSAIEADAAVRRITTLGVCTVGLMRYAGTTPWERHPDGDELLHVLDGAVDVNVLHPDGPAQLSMQAGSVFVCPRGLWHRQQPRPSVTMLFGTPSATTEVSFAEDPRTNH